MIEKVIVDGKELDAAKFLAALHNNTRAQGLGLLHDICRDLTPDEAKQILLDEGAFSFDYLLGRPLKTAADNDGVIFPGSRYGYDRDAGDGAFDRAITEASK